MFSNAKNVEINGKTVKSIILENGGILYKGEPYYLSVTSDKDILSYSDNDVANLTINYTKNETPYNGTILCSTFPDFFDGTNLYIPFETGNENWEIMLRGTVRILNEDKTLYDTIPDSYYRYVRYHDGVATTAGYMQEAYSISLPKKGFFLITPEQLIPSSNGFTSLGGPSFGLSSMSNGVANISYNSRGVGDVTFYFFPDDGTLRQKTYSIEDCVGTIINNITLTSDKDILSYHDNDSALLTARLTKNAVRIQGEEVKFYIVEDVPAGLSFTGTDFTITSSSEGLSGNNIVIDWGDGSTTTYAEASDLNHTYTSEGDYFITITGATSFENSCFKNRSGLTSVVIPEGVTSLEGSCFYGCSNLTSVVIPESVTNLGNSCFNSCSNLTSIVISEGVTSLGNSCFNKCSSLTSVVIPESITSLGSACFSDCPSLTSIVIPKGITSLETACFRNSGLTSIVIPEGVTGFGTQCFGSCSNLTSIMIPEGVTSFGTSCFNNCSGLTSIVIPESVTSLGGSCFRGCSNLTSVICNWITNPPTFNSSWIGSVHSSFKFSIPNGTTQAYIDAGYPSSKLVERSE